MKVLMLAAASSVHAVRWANALAARGCDLLLVTQHAPDPSLASAIRVEHLAHRAGAGYLLNRGRVMRLARGFRPDVVNAHYATGYGTLARAVRGVPVVLNVWGSDVEEFPASSAIHRWWLRRNLMHASHLVSTSEAMAAHARALIPQGPPVAVIPFGVDTMVFHPRASSDHHDGGPVIGTVKALAPVYGIDVLIAAFARIAGDHPGATLRIVGDGPQRAELERSARSRAIADRVQFTGAVRHEDVPAHLRAMDVFVALSRRESFGVSVLEACASALPVVVSAAEGLRELVQHDRTGAVVPIGDADAAAAALSRLLADPALRARWGSAGRDLAASRYEWSACVDRMMQLLSTITSPASRA